jgi:LGFP repeat
MPILTTVLPFDDAPMPGTTVARTGTKPVVAVPPPPGTWATALATAATIAPSATVALAVTAGLTADAVIAHAVVQLDAYGTFLRVDDWLEVGFTADQVGLVPTMTATLAGTKLVVAGEPQPALQPGQWAVVQVLVSADQVAVIIAGTAYARLPLAAAFTPPSPVTKVRLGSRAGSPAVTAALLGLGDDLPANVTTALEVAEITGFGETVGGFYRAGAKSTFGSPVGVASRAGTTRYQRYDKGVVYFTPGVGTVAVDGKIYDHYTTLNAHDGLLGLPLTDVMAGTAPYASRNRIAAPTVTGDLSSMVRFEHGVITSSKSTGTKEITGPIARHWLLIGGPTSPVGLPVGKLEESPHGWRHHFQFGDIYSTFDGACAEVHGDIVDRYDHSGAWDGPLGLPVVDEAAIDDPKNPGRRVSRFEHGAIYWSPSGKALLIPADWNDAYQDAGGPVGPLGLPAHEPRQVGAPSTVKYLEFEHGLMVHHPPEITFRVVDTIELILVTAKAPDIDDGIEFPLDSDRDAELIVHVSVSVDGTPKPGWDQRRFPNRGHTGKSIEFPHGPITVPVVAATKITVKFEAEDWDLTLENDALGGFEATYGLDTVWGELGPTQSKYRETGHGGDGDVIYEYSLGLPAGPVDGPFRQHKWWEFINGGTDRLTRRMYAEVFEDVEAVHNPWDTAVNPLDALYFELAVKGCASAGNCYGMASLAHRSLFQLTNMRLPLDRWGPANVKIDDGTFPGWLRGDVNRDHMKQLGSSVVGKLLSAFTSNDIFEPTATANRIVARIKRGDLPIISMLKGDLSGGHAVLAYGLSPRPGLPDRILVADPNCPWATEPDEQKCYIEADNNNTWRFVSARQTGPYALFFDVDHGAVCAPTITPMADMEMGVDSVLSALVIIGGDSSDRGVQTGDAQSTMQHIPMLDGNPQVRWFGAQGAVPSAVTAVIAPNGKAPFDLYAATANHRVTISTTFAEQGKIAAFEIQRFASARPSVTAKLKQGPTAAQVRIATRAGRAMRDGWVADARVRISGDETFRFGFTTVGAGLELQGLAGGRAPEVTLRAAADGPGSRYRLTGLGTASAIVLRPVDMASPFGSQLLDVAGSVTVVDPTSVA